MACDGGNAVLEEARRSFARTQFAVKRNSGDSCDAATDSSGSEDDADDPEKTPGFGVVVGLAGTVGGSVLAARRLASSDDLTERD
ncbi:PGF-CTERM sorting domain-containing protein [Natrinema caseinilyticum]|uniref:PGF-CTERM sorting domain-containing protein n=1 Tax=Natrinema caseinilyticum TaxID=2961570 RepID=UPI0020C2D00E|nr:PGF-CTERM sorting domain-containing protein [Natrinema caseinilyticum]